MCRVERGLICDADEREVSERERGRKRGVSETLGQAFGRVLVAVVTSCRKMMLILMQRRGSEFTICYLFSRSTRELAS